MHKPKTKVTTFIGKSLLWSALLYICAVIILDWKDLKSTFYNGNEPQIVHTSTPESPISRSISADTLGKKMWKLPKSIFINAISYVIKDYVSGN